MTPSDSINSNPVALAQADPAILLQWLDGVSPAAKKSAVRENCSKAILEIAAAQPQLLLPHWDTFVDLLRCDNGFSKYVAVYAIAGMAGAPGGSEHFERALDAWFALLDDESVMVASHTAKLSGAIAKALPHLQNEITDRLLKVEGIHLEPERKELVKSYVIEAFEQYLEESQQKDKMLAFAWQQQECHSPRLRKAARTFLKNEKAKKPKS